MLHRNQYSMKPFNSKRNWVKFCFLLHWKWHQYAVFHHLSFTLFSVILPPIWARMHLNYHFKYGKHTCNKLLTKSNFWISFLIDKGYHLIGETHLDFWLPSQFCISYYRMAWRLALVFLVLVLDFICT